MEWILLVWVFSGEHHHVQEIEFSTKYNCLTAKEWVIGQSDNKWGRKYRPKAECFKI